jgi:hypothetical protein
MNTEGTPTEGFWASTWASTKATLKWIGAKLLGPGAAFVLVTLAVVLVCLGYKELQIGGLLGRLLGRKDPEQKAVDKANSVPSGRVDDKGRVILPGTPDNKGQTQAVVVPIQEPGLFSNPDTVTFTPPGKTEPIEIQLPDGVKNKDVDKVVVVKPDVYAVTVKDSSGVPSAKVEDLIRKYGS